MLLCSLGSACGRWSAVREGSVQIQKWTVWVSVVKLMQWWVNLVFDYTVNWLPCNVFQRMLIGSRQQTLQFAVCIFIVTIQAYLFLKKWCRNATNRNYINIQGFWLDASWLLGNLNTFVIFYERLLCRDEISQRCTCHDDGPLHIFSIRLKLKKRKAAIEYSCWFLYKLTLF